MRVSAGPGRTKTLGGGSTREVTATVGPVRPGRPGLPAATSGRVRNPPHRDAVVLEPLVVEAAHQCSIGDTRRAAVGPPGSGVVDLADRGRSAATDDHAAPISRDDSASQVPHKCPLHPSDVDHLGVGTEHDASDLAVLGYPAKHVGGDGPRSVFPLGRGRGHEAKQVDRGGYTRALGLKASGPRSR